MRPCLQPGCKRLVVAGRCEQHAAQSKRDYERARGSSSARLYGWRWRRARAIYLRANPLCVRCMPRITGATDVDHVVPHNGNERLFWDEANWQPLCHSCHSTKTATEDGGYSNPTSPRR